MKKLSLFLVALICAVSCTTKKPQTYSKFYEGKIGDVVPKGWLAEILERQRDGLTGHPEAMAYPYNSCLWAGDLKRDGSTRGLDWWRFEQTAYYLDGLARLGYVLDDEELLKVWNENLEYVLAHPLPFKAGVPIEKQEKELRQLAAIDSLAAVDPDAAKKAKSRRARIETQMEINAIDRPEGRLGKDTESMAWPFAVFFRAMKAGYEATGDERIPKALEKSFLSYSVTELGKWRSVVNVEGILWTYSITGNKALLDLAEAAWAQGESELTQEKCLDDEPFRMHGVTMCELLKIPMILYSYTGDEKYLDAALHAMEKMESRNMLVDGVNSSSEYLAGRGPLASHETCDISDYTWTAGYYLMTTGDSGWADRIEKAIFNAGLGAITKDFRSIQYFSCPNQFIATGNSDHNAYRYGSTWMAYRPIHETECCIGNVHRYMPNYVSRMWMSDAEGQPVAALYGPSEVEYDLGGGVTVLIKEKTAYPFEEKIDFEFSFFKNGKPSDKAHRMDFTYRIPGWCKGRDAGFVKESREWRSGDVFTVEFPMEVEFVENIVSGVSVLRGPLVYSYAIPCEQKEDTAVYANLAGKTSGNPDFKSWSMIPSGKWNYAMACSDPSEVQVEKCDVSGFPFDLQSVPVKIKVPVRGVKGWSLVENRFTPALPDAPKAEDGTVRSIELVPYGSTTLRLTVFPVLK